nr:DUF1566 domain-containing protein [Halorhodospira abdelmalekii]
MAKVLVVILSLLALVVAVGWLVYQVFSVFFAEDDVPSGVHEKTDSYVIYDNGTVFDKANEIQWTACLFGQEWTDGSCTGSAEEHTWENVENAADDANGASLAGHSDWRIPEADELRAFAEMGLGFNEGAVVWSATEQRGISGFAHAFELGQRGVQRISTGEERAVVLMRSPEVDDEGCEDCYR